MNEYHIGRRTGIAMVFCMDLRLRHLEIWNPLLDVGCSKQNPEITRMLIAKETIQ